MGSSRELNLHVEAQQGLGVSAQALGPRRPSCSQATPPAARQRSTTQYGTQISKLPDTWDAPSGADRDRTTALSLVEGQRGQTLIPDVLLWLPDDSVHSATVTRVLGSVPQAPSESRTPVQGA